jgi:two-component system NtrC family sensor kinase
MENKSTIIYVSLRDSALPDWFSDTADLPQICCLERSAVLPSVQEGRAALVVLDAAFADDLTVLLQAAPDLPVVLFDAQGRLETCEKALRLGASGCIFPRMPAEECVGVIREVLGRARRRQAARTAVCEIEHENWDGLARFLQRLPEGLLAADSNGCIRMANQAAVEALARGDTLRVGQYLHEIFSEEEMQCLRAQEDAAPRWFEYWPDGQRVYAVRSGRTAAGGWLLTIQDISQQKKLDRIKTEFVHTVSHDLRSPLTAILGYVELMERAGPVTDMQRDFIRRIHGSVSHITRLMDDLLDLGRIESGMDDRRENVRIDQILYRAIEEHRKALAGKGLQVQVKLDDDFPTILANPVQLRQMVEQILENGIRYSFPSTHLSMHGWLEENQVILQFADQGIGIPAADLPHIFDKFYRAANAAGEVSGTGLGLAIVQEVVQNHGGRVWVESREGAGTTFTVVLPFVQA